MPSPPTKSTINSQAGWKKTLWQLRPRNRTSSQLVQRVLKVLSLCSIQTFCLNISKLSQLLTLQCVPLCTRRRHPPQSAEKQYLIMTTYHTYLQDLAWQVFLTLVFHLLMMTYYLYLSHKLVRLIPLQKAPFQTLSLSTYSSLTMRRSEH